MLDCECNRADCGFGGGAGLLDCDGGGVLIDRSERVDGCGFDLFLFPVKYNKKNSLSVERNVVIMDLLHPKFS